MPSSQGPAPQLDIGLPVPHPPAVPTPTLAQSSHDVAPAPPPAAREPIPRAVPLDPTKLSELRDSPQSVESYLRAQMAHIIQLEKDGQTELAKQQRVILTQRAEKTIQTMIQISLSLQAEAATAGRPPIAGPATQPAVAPHVQPVKPSAPAPVLRPGTWTGTLVWCRRDPDTSIQRVVHARVAMSCPDEHINNMRPETWPPSWLALSQHPAVPEQVLLEWLRQHKFVPLTIQPAFFPSDPLGLAAKANVVNCIGLISALSEKNIYALSAWPGANGVPKNRLLIISPNKRGLAAAYFPLPGGVPELPKGDAFPIPGPSSAPALTLGPQSPVSPSQRALPQFVTYMQQNLSQEQQARFCKLPSEGRMIIIKHFAQRMLSERRQQWQQAAAQQLQPATNSSANLANSGVGVGGDAARAEGEGEGAQNVSFDMMQSFIQMTLASEMT